MKTCATCSCWKKTGQSHAPRRIVHDNGAVLLPAGGEGECRLGGPLADFRWPLTLDSQGCMAHREAGEPKPDAGLLDALARLERELEDEARARARPDGSAELNLAPYAQDDAADGLRTGSETLSTGTGDAAPASNGTGGPAAAVDAATPQSTAPQTEAAAQTGASHLSLAPPARAPQPVGNRGSASRPSPRRTSR